MNRNEIAEKFGNMWRRSRTDAGFSQEHMARSLGVSKKTIQNWESGIGSPSQLMGFLWFKELDVPALPYYLSLLYDEFEDVSPSSNDDNIKDALIRLISDLDSSMVRKLLFLLYGDHGSSINGILELMVAYVHTPLPARLGVAQLIYTNYDIAKAFNKTANHVEPNTNYLSKAIEQGKKAVIEKRNSYLGGDLE